MTVNFVTTNQLLYGAALAAAIALVAGAARLLTFSGALAALVIGFLVFGFGGVPFAVPLLVFFFSSSLLSRVGSRRKAVFTAVYDKGSTRDAGQAMANGGIPALLALLSTLDLRLLPSRTCFILYLAALAAVNADTWATEIGSLAVARPRLVSTLRLVDPGTSGAVSPLGLVAAFAGALAIAITGWAIWPAHSIELFWRIDAAELAAVTWGGFVAAFADSVLGAGLQGMYRCPRCGAVVEAAVLCGVRGQHERGMRWVTNDLVNLATCALGVLFAWVLLTYVAYRWS